MKFYNLVVFKNYISFLHKFVCINDSSFSFFGAESIIRDIPILEKI